MVISKKRRFALQAAVRQGDILRARKLLKRITYESNNKHLGQLVNDPRFNGAAGYTLLHDAIASKNPQLMTKFLLDIGADPNLIGDNSEYPLQHTVEVGQADVACLLIDKGARTDIKVVRGLSRGSTVLMEAVYFGEEKIVEKLLRLGEFRGKDHPFEKKVKSKLLDMLIELNLKTTPKLPKAL